MEEISKEVLKRREEVNKGIKIEKFIRLFLGVLCVIFFLFFVKTLRQEWFVFSGMAFIGILLFTIGILDDEWRLSRGEYDEEPRETSTAKTPLEMYVRTWGAIGLFVAAIMVVAMIVEIGPEILNEFRDLFLDLVRKW